MFGGSPFGSTPYASKLAQAVAAAAGRAYTALAGGYKRAVAAFSALSGYRKAQASFSAHTGAYSASAKSGSYTALASDDAVLVATGTYIGTGSALTIQLPFTAKAAFVRVSTAPTNNCAFATDSMAPLGLAKLLAVAASPTAGIISSVGATLQIGTNAAVNTAGLTYAYIALGGDGVETIFYQGNGLAGRTIATTVANPVLFTSIRRAFSGLPSSKLGTDAPTFAPRWSTGTPVSTDGISLAPNLITVGSSSNVNAANSFYYALVIGTGSNVQQATYTGTGAALDIAAPFEVCAFMTWGNTKVPCYRTPGMNLTAPFTSNQPFVGVTGFGAKVSLNSNASVNQNGIAYQYLVLGERHSGGTPYRRGQTPYDPKDGEYQKAQAAAAGKAGYTKRV